MESDEATGITARLKFHRVAFGRTMMNRGMNAEPNYEAFERRLARAAETTTRRRDPDLLHPSTTQCFVPAPACVYPYRPCGSKSSHPCQRIGFARKTRDRRKQTFVREKQRIPLYIVHIGPGNQQPCKPKPPTKFTIWFSKSSTKRLRSAGESILSSRLRGGDCCIAEIILVFNKQPRAKQRLEQSVIRVVHFDVSKANAFTGKCRRTLL